MSDKKDKDKPIPPKSPERVEELKNAFRRGFNLFDSVDGNGANGFVVAAGAANSRREAPDVSEGFRRYFNGDLNEKFLDSAKEDIDIVTGTFFNKDKNK